MTYNPLTRFSHAYLAFTSEVAKGTPYDPSISREYSYALHLATAYLRGQREADPEGVLSQLIQDLTHLKPAPEDDHLSDIHKTEGEEGYHD